MPPGVPAGATPTVGATRSLIKPDDLMNEVLVIS